MKVTWQGLQKYLEQVDTFDDNDGYFQSYVVKPHIVLQLNTDDAGEWDTVNYVQHMAADEDCGECIVLQITEAPEDPPNYNLAAEYDIKVFLEVDDEMVSSISYVVENELDFLKNTSTDWRDDERPELSRIQQLDLLAAAYRIARYHITPKYTPTPPDTER